SYTVSNSPKAKDRIGTWALVVPVEDEAFEMSHFRAPQNKGWSGKNRSVMSKAPRVGLPGWPMGCFARWFRQEESKLVVPGSSVDGFEISSANKPGFTTAFFASDIAPPFELMQGAPAIFDNQLEFYSKDPAWRERPRVTIGPRYPGNTSDLNILKDFQAGIERLVRNKKLDMEYLFIKEFLKTMGAGIRINTVKVTMTTR